MIQVLVVGAAGRMGQEVVQAVQAADGLQLMAAIDQGESLQEALEQGPQVAVDFTTPEVVSGHLEAYVAAGVRPVIGTTGLPAQILERAQAQARERQLGGIVAPNFALGAVLMMSFAARAARFMEGVEITEYHHPRKLDAPSGTALLTRDKIRQAQGAEATEVPIHSVRLGGYLASQEVFLGGSEERLTIRHDSLHRRCFMPGVVLACRKVPQLGEIVLGLEHLLELD